MCGIYGFYSYTGAEATTEAELLMHAHRMKRRGPDGFGAWLGPDGSIGLAHRRLAIIDLSPAGAQPMSYADGRYQISFNGEIYNYRELKSQLQSKGYSFRSDCDTEVLLALYAERGPGMVNDLRGMFAFGLWDNVRRELLLARDPLGIKPLYYADNGRTTRFASQVRALIGPEIDVTPDDAGAAGYYLWGHIPEPYTAFRGIRALEAGSLIIVRPQGQSTPKRYWSVGQALKNGESGETKPNGNERLEALRAALADSVEHHLIADVPVGVFLSAGKDSCAILGLAQERCSQPLQAVTLGFGEYKNTPLDEVPLAAAATELQGANHFPRLLTTTEVRNCFEDFLGVMDQPTVDGFNTYLVSKVTAEHGLKVALSGVGGDELLAGYGSFHQVPKSRRLLQPFAHMGAVGKMFRVASAPIAERFTSPKYAGLLEFGGTYEGAYLLRRALYMPWELTKVLPPEICRTGWEKLQPLLQLSTTISGLSSSRAIVSALEMRWYMLNQLLRDTDWASMAHSLEVRTPLVDRTLLENVASIASQYGWPDKQELIGAPRKPMPEGVTNRPKTGFTVPIMKWFPELFSSKDRHYSRSWAGYVFKRYWESVNKAQWN